MTHLFQMSQRKKTKKEGPGQGPRTEGYVITNKWMNEMDCKSPSSICTGDPSQVRV